MIDTLKNYNHAKIFIESVPLQIESLENKKNKNMIAKYGENQKGEGKSLEDAILDINAKIDLLRKNYKDAKILIESTERAMGNLSDEEIEITLGIYGNIDKKSKLKGLMDKYHYEKSQVYRMANHGLRYISLNMYGKC